MKAGDRATGDAPAANQTRLDDLVHRWQEGRQRGRQVSAEELCSECPEQLEPLKDRIRDLASMEAFLQRTQDGRSEGQTPPPSMAQRPGNAPPVDYLPSNLIPGYEILAELGRGGMGVVCKARHLRLGRLVAIKLIRPERLNHPEAVRRFYREIRAASQLSHPNIVHALDAGEAAGTHYFCMEYVDGTDLAEIVARQGALPVAQACECIRQAALGLQHAHERGLVHRDIKPHNLILVTGLNLPDGSQTAPPATLVKILDLGLARLTHGPASEQSSTMTQEGAVMGTPDYIAPEQTWDSRKVDIRADLYSLGCTLYFLLTGHAPFSGGSLGEKLVKHQLADPKPLEQIRPDVPPGVVAIVQKLMRKKPEERYQTPAELAAALDALTRPAAVETAQPPGVDQASLQSEPAADSSSLFEQYRAKRAARAAQQRKAYLVAGLASLVLLGGLIAGLAWTLWPEATPPKVTEVPTLPPVSKPPTAAELAAQAEKKRRAEAEEAERKRAAAADVAYKDLSAVLTAGTTFTEFAKKVGVFKGKYGGTPAAMKAAELLTKLRSPLDELDPGKLPDDIKAAWRAAGLDIAKSPVVAVLGEHRRRHLASVAFIGCPDNNHVVSHGHDNAVRIWNLNSGLEVKSFPERVLSPGYYCTTVLSPDGKLLACSLDTGHVKIWNLAEGKVQLDLPAFEGGHGYIAFTPDGLHLVTAVYVKNQVSVWDLASGHRTRTFTLAPEHQTVSIAASDQLIAVGTGLHGERGVKLLDRATGEVRATLMTEQLHTLPVVAFSHDGKRLATLSGGVRLWDINSGQELVASWPGTGLAFGTVAFSPDDTFLIAGSDQGLSCWNLKEGKEDQRFAGTTRYVTRVAFTPDGRMVVTGATDGTVRFWDFATGKEVQPLAKAGMTSFLAFSPLDNTLLLSRSYDPLLHAWHPQSGQEEQHQNLGFVPPSTPLSPDGSTFARGANEGMELCDLATGERKALLTWPLERRPWVLAFSPDGRYLAAGCQPGEVWVWELSTGRVRLQLNEPRSPMSLAWTADGRSLVTVDYDAYAHFYDAKTGAAQRTLLLRVTAHGKRYYLTPHGNQVVVTHADGLMAWWDISAGEEGKLLVEWKFPSWITHVAFSADGRHLAAGSDNGTVYIVRHNLPVEKVLGSAELERTVAEFILKAGGVIHTSNQYVPELAKLPTEPFKITAIDYAGRWKCSDADLEMLANLSGLQNLALSGTVTDAGIARMAEFAWAPRVKQLQVSSPELTDAAYQHAVKFPSLELLALDVSKQITGKGLVHLKGMPLRTLHLRHCAIADEALLQLKDLPQLTTLDLTHTPITDADLKHVSELRQLEYLILYGVYTIADDGFKHLESLKELQQIQLSAVPITDRGFASLAKLPKLKKLHLGHEEKLTDAGFQALATSASLEFIDINNTPLSDDGLMALAGLKTLKAFNLQAGTKVTAEGVKKFRVARPDVQLQSSVPEQ